MKMFGFFIFIISIANSKNIEYSKAAAEANVHRCDMQILGKVEIKGSAQVLEWFQEYKGQYCQAYDKITQRCPAGFSVSGRKLISM